jgi:hypothetical protein
MVFQLYLYCQLQWFGAFGFSECLCLYLLKYSSEGAETWQNHRLDISEYTDDDNQWQVMHVLVVVVFTKSVLPHII